ncbi:hypothetical protein IWQ60_005442 [Tieghemiomyces parasiticus]|uniref:DUF2423 domain-containing protein n=1 Tax=Tieghemiomyces parasiticus TaxID=78921 RepID=A0A9W8A699_9FUNG|nr:hypothetical protein IWQ60_005442 [Tieghemiomyces parasiticus]
MAKGSRNQSSKRNSNLRREGVYGKIAAERLLRLAQKQALCAESEPYRQANKSASNAEEEEEEETMEVENATKTSGVVAEMAVDGDESKAPKLNKWQRRAAAAAQARKNNPKRLRNGQSAGKRIRWSKNSFKV